ncbi:MAG: prepilin-type N-terminal cleavage/methylation domain-containing protein, partial [Armatimonadota bacterium]
MTGASGRGASVPRAKTAGARAVAGARGFTLVELLVALVVLLIGIYAMLRIFPRGFSAIEVSRQRTTAAQIAELELERWRLQPESLPDAIVATDYEGKLVEATLVNNAETLKSLLVYGEMAAKIPGSTDYRALELPKPEVNVGNLDFFARPFIYNPLDVTPSQFDAALAVWEDEGLPRPSTTHPNWQPNSLYLPRTVRGERIDIRGLGLTRQGIPFHLLYRAPLDVLRYEENPLVPGDWLTVYVDVYDAEPWQYRPDLSPTNLGEREFYFDPGTGDLHFGPSDSPPAQFREFMVDYTEPVTNLRVLGFTVRVPASSTKGDTALSTLVDPTTIQIHERLHALSYSEYKEYVEGEWLLWPRNAYYVDTKTTITGEIQFSPALQLDPRDDDIKLVKVNYRVYDWGILVFDVEVPPGGVTRLPVQHIKGSAFSNPPRQARPQEIARNIRKFYDWNGLEIAPSDPRSTWGYVVAVDLQTGDVLVDHEGAEWPTNAYERRSRFLVDYRAGLLHFNYDPWQVYEMMGVDTPDRSGRTYRIFCRAENDWAVQLMVAARQYARSADRWPGPRPKGAEEAAGGLTYAWNTDKPRQL